MSTQELIKKQITENDIIIYMKGTPQTPQCGFSARAVQILKSCTQKGFASVNVMDDPNIRQGIKDFSNWPTIPQLYIKGEFIGGCDIMTEMFASGELQDLIAKV